MAKLNKDIESMDFKDRKCNCAKQPPPNDGCGYNNVCRKAIVVYQMENIETGQVHIGSTQRHLKKRMERHNNDILYCHRTGNKRSSVANYYAAFLTNWPPGAPSARLIKNCTRHSVLWQGKALSAVKTFGTLNCKLCSKERLETFKRAQFKPGTLTNRRKDFHEACKHKPSFHRHTMEHSPDETQGSRKGRDPVNSNHRELVSV